MATNIEWTDESWNPVIGCTKVSAGCENCYAMKRAYQMTRNPKTIPVYGHSESDEAIARCVGLLKYNWTGIVRCLPERLEIPFHWLKPRMVFVNSMSDLFHEKVPFDFIDRIYAVMAANPRHIFQVLTKRPKRMKDYLNDIRSDYIYRLGQEIAIKKLGGHPGSEIAFPFKNIWHGVSVEDQKSADVRIPLLLDTPSAIRFVSYEPALVPINLRNIKGRVGWSGPDDTWFDAIHSHAPTRLDWVIAGGESGTFARPSHPDWFRRVRDDCAACGVPFFFKQWGEWCPPFHIAPGNISSRNQYIFGEHGERVYRVGKEKSGALLDGREHREFPEMKS